MTKALTTVDFLAEALDTLVNLKKIDDGEPQTQFKQFDPEVEAARAAHREANRPAMNPASIIWPEWPSETEAVITAMKPRGKRRDDGPVVILNKDWKPTA